jgi:carbon storage regulator
MFTLRALLPEWKHKELRMLVLSRRLNQAIVIAGQVRVTVRAITPSRVELGVEAPLEITVDREEIHLRRQQVEGDQSAQDLTASSQK